MLIGQLLLTIGHPRQVVRRVMAENTAQEDLLQLHGMTKLKELGIQETQVTDEGINKLQAALPALKTVHR